MDSETILEDEKSSLTMAEAVETIKQLRKVFNIVRLIDVRECQVVDIEADCKRQEGKCYEFWGKKQRCVDCVCSRVLVDKQQKSKYEAYDKALYQVVAKYLVIEGKTYVLELITKVTSNNAVINPTTDTQAGEYYSHYSDLLYVDALTQVYNRRFYEELMKNSTRTAGVAMLDIDDFKLYNDVYGHDVGDSALRTVARVAKECLKSSDYIIRYGGDELVLVLPDISASEFASTLKQICNKVHESIIGGYQHLTLSVSIGGVLMKDETVAEALQRADKFMYQAKLRKNIVITEFSSNEGGILNNEKKRNVLIVDDSEMNRFLLKEILKDEYNIIEAENGLEAMNIMREEEESISLMLLDIVMPVMNGFEVLQQMNNTHLIDKVPVIVISGDESVGSIRKAYEMRATDYINRPFDTGIVQRRVLNAVLLYAKQKTLMSLLKEQYEEKEKTSHIMIDILSHIVEFRNKESGTHVRNINKLTRMLLEHLMQKTTRYKLSYADAAMITNASTLHDIGKIAISDEILNKPGKLTKEEFDTMKTHTTIGAKMLEDLEMYKDEPFMKYAYEIARWHHERYDGNGYPDGLFGEQIPISAQVVSLADVYDALTSKRVYKPAFTHEKAVEMIIGGECGQFNPLLLQCFLEIKDDIQVMMQEN